MAGLAGGCSTAAPRASAPPRSRDRLRAAVIGLGNRGRGLAEWQTPPYADVLAICDVDLRRAYPAAKAIETRTARKVDVVQDYRRLLDRADIDVIINATCDHWHTRINLEACRAGKDVYCEKPLTLTIAEGWTLQQVVRDTGRIVQVGTQQRSGMQFQIACSLVRHGRIGQLKQIAVLLPGGDFKPRAKATADSLPAEVAWDVWLGQAPAVPFSASRLSYFRGWQAYGGGLITDWGAHHLDIAHWGMGGAEVGPLSVEAAGYNPQLGQPDYQDQFVPFAARFEYPSDIELFLLSSYAAAKSSAKTEPQLAELQRIFDRVPEVYRKDPRCGVHFIGTKGKIFVGRDEIEAEGIGELSRVPIAKEGDIRWRASMYEHMRNFLECVQTRRTPLCPVNEQHRTLIPCHLTNIALRLGRKLRWDPAREEFPGDPAANALRSRPQRAPYTVA
jgi:predicted dehydrogenase